MLRSVCVFAALLAAQFAHAGEAGKVIFVAGKAQIVDRPATLGLGVQEGELMKTGADGFIYIKTVDNGLFILRPNSSARIATYQVDSANPEKTQVKLELLSGVARAKSGDAVKAARQNFRFNTPVAAIGVRGTDFTVFTDQNETRVAVISGGVVVSGFGAGCTPDGGGPCEGKASVELFAAQRGKLLQVQRGSATPTLVPAGLLSPDNVSPGRPDEPTAKAGGIGVLPLVLNLDAQKGNTLKVVAEQNAAEVPTVTAPAEPPVVNPELPVTPPPLVVVPPVVTPEVAPSGIVWGRWQALASTPAKFSLINQKAKSELIAVNGNYALFRTPGSDYVAAEKGNIAFKLQESEAFVTTTGAAGIKTFSQAAILGGKLAVDFGTRTYATNLDMTSNADKFTMRSNGLVTSDGRIFGNGVTGAGVMNVQGLLSNENGGSAAYIFDGRLDDKRTVNGAAYWRK
ncbi:FecR family protein [Oxalobacteraceae bacterium OTU3CAMAD1]|nr:FecR family protein [Oxalobacteraceae bacterium OTU3CAMAD1]